MSLVEAAYTRRPAATPFARSAIQSEGTADLCASWRSGSRVTQEKSCFDYSPGFNLGVQQNDKKPPHPTIMAL